MTTSPSGSRGSRSDEDRSLDVVQRMIISALATVVVGSIASVLAGYVVAVQDELPRGRVIGLWVMTGVIGLVTAGAVLMINRKRPYSPWVVLGLLPMAVSAYWLFP